MTRYNWFNWKETETGPHSFGFECVIESKDHERLWLEVVNTQFGWIWTISDSQGETFNEGVEHGLPKAISAITECFITNYR